MNAKKLKFTDRKKRFFGFICLAICAGIFLVGLWPFNFWPENKVRWLKDQNGVHFYGQGIIYSEPTIPFTPFFHHSTIPLPHSSSILFKSITIEILVQPDSETLPYLPYLLSFYESKTFEGFFLAQWESTLILQSNILELNKKWTNKMVGLANALQKGQKRFISITSDDKETFIFMDGKLARAYPGFSLLSSKDNTVPCKLLVLGNSVTGKQFWVGKLFGLAIYDRALTHEQVIQHFQNWSRDETSFFMYEKDLVAFYPFNERSGNRVYDHIGRHHLFIPSRFTVLQRTILTPPWQDFKLNRSYLKDILTNILGFIPLGFFLSAYLWIRKSRPIYKLLFVTVLFAGSTSLAIELFQIYLPTRSSQLMDVITNILGTVIGVILFFKNRKSLGVSREP